MMYAVHNVIYSEAERNDADGEERLPCLGKRHFFSCLHRSLSSVQFPFLWGSLLRCVGGARIHVSELEHERARDGR